MKYQPIIVSNVGFDTLKTFSIVALKFLRSGSWVLGAVGVDMFMFVP